MKQKPKQGDEKQGGNDGRMLSSMNGNMKEMDNKDYRDRGRDREKKDLFETLLPNYQISEPLADKIREYLRYRKQQHRFTFQEVSLNAFLKKAEKAEQQYGSTAVMSCFDKTISNGWKGVFYESLPKPKDEQKERSLFEELKEKYGRNEENGNS
jgi:hypothetical protein